MEELINISDYCNAILIKHGQSITKCNAIYIAEDDVIEFRIQYHLDQEKNHKSFQYRIPNFNFVMTEVEVLVNKDTIDTINQEVEKRINLVKVKYEV